MSERRRWRWVTRDKGTEWDHLACIWPGLRRPKSMQWDSMRAQFTTPRADDVIDWQQVVPDHDADYSLDIDHREFRDMFGLLVGKGTISKVVFTASWLHTLAPGTRAGSLQLEADDRANGAGQLLRTPRSVKLVVRL